MNLAEKRRMYAQELEATLARVVEELARRPEVHRIILFGSFLRGRRDLFTDLDLLVVMDSSQDFVSRTAQLYQELDAPVDMDLFVYTPDELERNRNRGWVRKILEEGKVLYEK
ncbi:MAG: nucleotidyltransferase domain-containing protein [Chloroflexi bacterium]|nr:nucleotidyltransferase domain-containing protein [Chloroflexota bacterium]